MADIQSIDGKEEEGLLEEEDRVHRKNLQEQLCRLIFQEELKWKQRSSNKWLKTGGRNTKFLHSIASACRQVNWIYVLSARGRVWDKREGIERERERERNCTFFQKAIL